MALPKYSVLNQVSNGGCGISCRRLIIIITSIVIALLIIFSRKYVFIELGTKNIARALGDSEDDKTCMHVPQGKSYSLRLRPKPYKVPALEKGDYKKLINLNDFQFTMIDKDGCKEPNPFLVVLITSTPHNFKRRHAIRTTWGQRDVKVKSFFMLGQVSNNSSLQKDIENENEVYADIIQGNFVDSYRNLTYKSVMALKFVFYHCNKVTYVLKTDDDVFVNMPLMKNYLTNDLSPFGAENYLQCHVMRHLPILRDKPIKWRVTVEEFPGKEYPTYCNGPYSLMSPDVLFKIYKGAQSSKYFYIEDVFLYGVSAGKYPEINHTDSRPFALWRFTKFRVSRGTFDHINFLFGPFGVNVDQMLEFWNLVTSKTVPSSIYYYYFSDD